MKNLTIGKKIALGFGALILIAALLGGFAVLNMKSVQTQSRKLSEGYVPESQVAGDLQDAVAVTRLAVRSYGFTAEGSYLADTRKGLAEIHRQQAAAQQLADAHPELVKLHEDLKNLDPLLQSFSGYIDQTEAKNNEILAARQKLNTTAADFMAKIDNLISTQRDRLEGEIKASNEAPKLLERVNKLMLATDIRAAGNAARIAAFKSQALRDPQIIDAGLKNFDLMDQKFDALLALLKVQDDIDALNAARADAHTYRDAMSEIQADDVALTKINALRVEAADRLDALIQDTQATGMKRTVEAADTSSKTLANASWKMLFGLIIALLVAVTVAYFIIRNSNHVLTTVANALNQGSNQVSAAAGQVSAASQTLAEGASEQASSLEQSSSSLEEMSSMTRRNSEHARKANELAKEARDAAEKGAGDMQTMSAAMHAIKASSDDIAKIIQTIDEIAFQTNILALNAAVEAARAGEAGMGFAVVADEVRNLAQRCAQAAKETSGKIAGAIAKTGQGVEISSKVEAALNEIVGKIRQVDELVSEVAGASREQTEGVTQINAAVGQMDKVTQGNAATAEESAAAAEELNAQAEVMQQSVTELLLLVGGKQVAGTSHQARPKRPAAHVKLPAHGQGAEAAPQTFPKASRRSEIPLENGANRF